MKELGFDMAYLAQYSPRSGTLAAKLKDDVPKKEKRRRERELNDILTKTALTHNKKYLNKRVAVLIKEIKNGYALGKTATQKTVRLPAQKFTPGEMINITVKKISAWGLTGKIEK
jgi:tRNA-2-methylthio-N6-dimethylallyladenosine synthase